MGRRTEQLYLAVLGAVNELFTDKSVSTQDTRDALADLREEIDAMLQALDDDLRQGGHNGTATEG